MSRLVNDECALAIDKAKLLLVNIPMQLKKLKGKSASYILLYLAIAGGIILAGPKLPLVPEGTRWEDVVPMAPANDTKAPDINSPAGSVVSVTKTPSATSSATTIK
jgi:hypothetical protein